MPVTVAWGDRDRLLVGGQARRAWAMLPAARHLRLAGCGHVPMSDDPPRVATVLLETEQNSIARTGQGRPVLAVTRRSRKVRSGRFIVDLLWTPELRHGRWRLPVLATLLVLFALPVAGQAARLVHVQHQDHEQHH
jgi:hypothetical protein